MSFVTPTKTWPRTTVKLTLSLRTLVTNTLLSPGELVVLLLVFLVFLEEEHPVLVKLLLVTCAERVVCSTQPRLGEDGTDK